MTTYAPSACALEQAVSHQTSVMNAKKLRLIFRKAGIEFFLDYVLANNKSKCAYHSTTHCISVALRADLIVQVSTARVSSLEYRELLLAALFHDFNYQESLDETENVALAIKSFKVACETYFYEDSVYDSARPLRIPSICRLIAQTTYPYVDDDSDLDFTCCVLRDADRLAVCDADWRSVLLDDLRAEQKLDLTNFIDLQFKFLVDLAPYTPAGRELLESAYPITIWELNSIKNINA